MMDGREPNTNLSRRGFLRRTTAAVAAGGAGVGLYTWRVEPHWPEVIERTMPLAGLPSSLEGKRLVQVSDLHIGPVVDKRWMIGQLQRLERLRPDAIVLTGDFMTCDHAEQLAQAEEVLAELAPAPLGRFAVLGNHDYGHRWSFPKVADGLVDRMERLDIRVLQNEVADAGGLQIAGLDEFMTRRFDAERTARDLATDRDAVALVHNPDAADERAWASFRGWFLAGHTHGGQCKPPFFEPPVLPCVNRSYIAGEYRLAEGRRMYINRGLGYLRRVRFNCRPEITVFTLAAA